MFSNLKVPALKDVYNLSVIRMSKTLLEYLQLQLITKTSAK